MDKKEKYLIIIQADENDADYIYSISVLNSKNKINKFINLAKKIKKEYDNWVNQPETVHEKKYIYDWYKDILTQKEIKFLDTFMPIPHYSELGIHTAETIIVLKIHPESILYKKNYDPRSENTIVDFD